LEEDFKFCDNTRRKRDFFEGRKYLLPILEAVQQTEERFDLEHIIRVVRGEADQYVQSYGHTKLPVFGKGGKEETEEFWESIVRQGMIFKYLMRDLEHVTIMKLTEKGKDFIEEPTSVMMSKDLDYSSFESDEEEDISPPTGTSGSFDKALFDMLKKLRKEMAKKKSLPPYVIFQDPSLEEMATTYPTTEQELTQVNGVGMSKVKKFGQPFLDVIKNYIEENDIMTATDVVVKSTANRSKTKIFIIQQIDRQVDVEEISEAKDMTLSQVIDEIEHICYSGTKLNLDYYIEQIMDDERQDEVIEYFMTAESDSIQAALEELGEDEYSEEELRLMRIKFLSQVAM
jgi:ATP-dependent DNA helicase RecQ